MAIITKTWEQDVKQGIFWNIPTSKIKVYTSKNYHEFNEHLGNSDQEVKKYFDIFLQNNISDYFDNINAEVGFIKIKGGFIPFLVPDNGKRNNSYVCSPITHYTKLPVEIPYLIKNRFAKYGAKFFFNFLEHVFRKCDTEKVVYVNHWLFSTDLHPQDFHEDQVREITENLTAEYPNHAIAFRSINDCTAKSLKNSLDRIGYRPIVSRQIFISRPSDPAVHTTRIVKSDLKLLRENPYEVVKGHQLTEIERKMVYDLHISFTINNHSKYNPKISQKLLHSMIENNSLTIVALRKDGIILGAIGFIVKDKVLTCPFFGYDISHPEKSKIYRILSTLLFTEAKNNELIFHQSAGASFYKTLRRSVPYMEHLYVYTKGLKLKQSLGWKFLQAIMNTFAVRFMKKY